MQRSPLAAPRSSSTRHSSSVRQLELPQAEPPLQPIHSPPDTRRTIAAATSSARRRVGAPPPSLSPDRVTFNALAAAAGVDHVQLSPAFAVIEKMLAGDQETGRQTWLAAVAALTIPNQRLLFAALHALCLDAKHLYAFLSVSLRYQQPLWR